MKLYRIKDKKTGLYYCKSRDLRVTHKSGAKSWVKSNLSETGKIYKIDHRKSIRYISDHTKLTWSEGFGGRLSAASKVRYAHIDDLILEEIKLK